jgi:hypothetical protein
MNAEQAGARADSKPGEPAGATVSGTVELPAKMLFRRQVDGIAAGAKRVVDPKTGEDCTVDPEDGTAERPLTWKHVHSGTASIRANDGRNFKASARIEPGGRFKFESPLPPGGYQVDAELYLLMDDQANRSPRLSEQPPDLIAGTVLLRLGPKDREASAQLKAFPAAFTRRVRHEDPMQRGPELTIALQAPAKQAEAARINLYAGLATRWRIADASMQVPGAVRFENLRSTMTSGRQGSFLVGIKVEHPSLVPADGRSWRDVRIPLRPGTKQSLEIALADGGFVQGQLKDDSGMPLAGLDLRLLQRVERDDRFVDYVKTDAEGRFRSAALAVGEYRIEQNDADRKLFGVARVEAGKTTTFDRK